jgi:cytochrome c peroxidase
MKVLQPLIIALVFVTNTAATLQAKDGVLDLTTLHNYANQNVPAYARNRDNTPLDNAITDAGATLGRVLFYDKRLSRNNTISCASCHQQAHAFGDTATASTGVDGITGRHSMRLINARFATEHRFFWDERATDLEDQTTRPIQDHVEMGFSGASGDPVFADLVTKLSAIDEYRVLFALTFGSATINETRIQHTLAQFVRSIQSFDSKYDAGRAVAGADDIPFTNFTTSENNGKDLFVAPPPQGGGGCAGCHRPPHFDIDPTSRNNGVITSLSGGTDLTNTRSPSLRDLIAASGQPHGGMMHDGSFTTLEQVLNHYNLIPADNTNLDNRLRRPGGNLQNLHHTQQQRNDIAAFLRTLTGSAVYTDEKWSDPFNSAGELALIILPTAAMTVQNHGNGTATLRCTAAPGLTYQFQTSGDLKAWANAGSLTADLGGLLVKSVTVVPSKFYRFTYTP